MKITFTKDCPPILDAGWSAYKEGTQADLRRGALLVKSGYAREGWEPVAVEPEPQPSIYANEKANATKGAVELANKHGLQLHSIADGDKRISVNDVKKWVED